MFLYKHVSVGDPVQSYEDW